MAPATTSKSRKKVRTGCKTCKIRRVKCDEGRPSCQRCILAGRICNGYGIWGGGDATKQQQGLIAERSRIAIDQVPSIMSSDEQYYLDWFRTRSMFKLPGAFISPFWKVVLTQSSVTEPSIRHAVVALSSFHCSTVLGTELTGPGSSDDQSKTTLEQYNNAINSLTSRFSIGDAESIRVVVVTCIVFVFLDYLRGRYQLAKSHLEHGVRLWKQFQVKQISSGQAATYVDDWISQTLNSLQLQSVMFGQSSASSAEAFSTSKRRTDSFSCVNEAKAALDNILLNLYSFWENEVTKPRPKNRVHPLWFGFQEDLSTWVSLLVRFSTSKKLDPLGQVACRLLKTYHVMGKILLETCRDGNALSAFENHTSDFMFIIEQGVDMYKIASRQNWHEVSEPDTVKASRGISDIGTIPPLYFTAIHCQDRKLRMEAIRLLQSLAHKEGIWDAELAAAIASKVIQLEHSPSRTAEKIQNFLGVSTSYQKTEKDAKGTMESVRISDINVILPDHSDGLVILQCLRGGERLVHNFDLKSQQWLS